MRSGDRLTECDLSPRARRWIASRSMRGRAVGLQTEDLGGGFLSAAACTARRPVRGPRWDRTGGAGRGSLGGMWTLLAALFGALGVMLGAFGARALKARLEPAQLDVWSTAVEYHLIHAVALLAVALFGAATDRAVSWPAAGFTAGILLFSGSLYGLALGGPRWLGPSRPWAVSASSRAGSRCSTWPRFLVGERKGAPSPKRARGCSTRSTRSRCASRGSARRRGARASRFARHAPPQLASRRV